MTRSTTCPARAAAGALTLALAFTWSVPARAAEPSPVRPIETRSLAAATSARLAKLDTKDALRATQSATPAAATGDSPSFFKSPKGIAVLLLMAVGTGYTIYSAKDERIDNPLR